MRWWLAAVLLVPAPLAFAGDDSPEALVQDFLKTLKEIRPVLLTVKDKETAEKARPKLLELNTRFVRFRERAEALRKDAKQAKPLKEVEKKYAKEVESLLEAIDREAVRVVKLPGVRLALRDVALVEAAGHVEKTRRTRAQVAVRNLTTAVEAYHARNSEYPPSLAALTEKQPGGGRPLLEPDNLLDPWGRPYVFEPGTLHPKTGQPLLYSHGPRPGDKSGRITNWPAEKK